MSDNELLLAISNMMDKKLEPITKDVQEIKEDVKTLKKDVRKLKADVEILKTDVKNLENRLDNLENRFDNLENKVATMDSNIKSIDIRVKKIELNQETEIQPQLNTILSCYTDTYDRYREYTDKMENAFDDIELLKKVVAEHSIKLQNIS